ncbi:MAG: prepilin-type N-terminal cleavage/methylation domain-containing protein [Kiritimatiellae bacterium]|nr:prepilin-type N-terminal cleavage/methylation domain-containing protein [Kiritimatiellia bacterium]
MTTGKDLGQPESRAGSTRGFTLIEMLVVVLIIVLLAGMVFRTVGVIGRNNDIAASRAKVEKLANAVEEFKAIYGRYPPVSFYSNGSQPIEFEFATVRGMGDSAAENIAKAIRNSDKKNEVLWSETPLFTFGLLSFFLPRYNGFVHDSNDSEATMGRYPYTFAGIDNGTRKRDQALKQYVNFNKFADGKAHGDTERDLAAVRRILPLLGGKLKYDDSCVESYGIIESDIRIHPNNTGQGSQTEFTNRIYFVRDAWYNWIHYRSLPPYETYKIWSNGPDGKTGVDKTTGKDYSTDDIVAGQG